MLLPSAASVTLLASHVLSANSKIVESVTTTPPSEQAVTAETLSSTKLNTDCTPVLGPVDDRDVDLLKVIFSGTIDGTTYAQWLVSYASLLVAQIDDVASQALVDTDGRYTTAFNTIDVVGILDFASAAPMYTCFLSSLWNDTLPDSHTFAGIEYPPWRKKAKLMVLFEKRNDDNGDYNLAQILVRETENLLAEMNCVIADQLTDPYGYTSLFTTLNVRQLISIAFPGPARAKVRSTNKLTALNFCSTFSVNRNA